MRKFTLKEMLIIAVIFVFGAFVAYFFTHKEDTPTKRLGHWQFQSIDTMKESRDMARQDLNDPNFPKEVDREISDIAATGATHVAIATPYDDEFQPVLKTWVRSARQHGLKVWFRGNWSGWESWFGYSKIDEKEHTENTRQFVLNNPGLFEDGDIFSSCPECENAMNLELGNSFAVADYRKFLIDDYKTTKNAFKMINKNVASNYYSMNADVAKAIMDQDTTTQLDGIVTIDHYVQIPDQFRKDITQIAQQSGGKIVVGEMGAPIPDINGPMDEAAQAEWLSESLQVLSKLPQVEGVNYWVNKGGTTALWKQNNTPKKAVQVLKEYYGG